MERNRETNYEDVYYKSEMCINHIKDKLKGIYHLCERQPTIERSNALYNQYLDKFKKEAFKMVETSVVKPFVVYRVNKHYLTN